MNPSPTELLARVERTVHHQQLFRPGDTLVVALSGGADSAALLDLLTKLPGYDLHLIVAHLNHCLRGAESDTDQEFCRDLASHHKIPFEFRRIDVKKMASASRLNLEDAGRRARIQFLDDIYTKYAATAVVLAHHADDQAETVLMRLLRGSGMAGLSGMTYRNSHGFIRPLLDVTRVEIEQYLRCCSLEWREDASNSDTVYLRNRIRHQLLPLLEQYNPAIRKSLNSTALILSGDEALLSELTEQAFGEVCRVEEEGIACSVGKLRGLNIALKRRVIRHAFKQLTGTLQAVSLRHINAIFEIIDSDRPNSRLDLPQSVTALREYDRLLIMRQNKLASETSFELVIPEPGDYQLPSGGTMVVKLVSPADFLEDLNSVYFDLDKIPFPLVVRTFRPGDRMVPFGMSGRKKVKDIFIDKKIQLAERRRIPFLLSGDDLIWVAGVSVAERCRIVLPVSTLVQVAWH